MIEIIITVIIIVGCLAGEIIYLKSLAINKISRDAEVEIDSVSKRVDEIMTKQQSLALKHFELQGEVSKQALVIGLKISKKE